MSDLVQLTDNKGNDEQANLLYNTLNDSTSLNNSLFGEDNIFESQAAKLLGLATAFFPLEMMQKDFALLSQVVCYLLSADLDMIEGINFPKDEPYSNLAVVSECVLNYEGSANDLFGLFQRIGNYMVSIELDEKAEFTIEHSKSILKISAEYDSFYHTIFEETLNAEKKGSDEELPSQAKEFLSFLQEMTQE